VRARRDTTAGAQGRLRNLAGAACLLSLALPLAACGGHDHARLTGESLAVDPCRGDAARLFAPVDLSFDRALWNRAADVAILHLRRGWRDPNDSDQLALEIADLPALLARRSLDPAADMPFDGQVRIALVLGQDCPDMVQSLEAREGAIRFHEVDLAVGGRLSGMAFFDLRDTRAGPGEPPAGVNLVLDFEIDLSDKDPETGEGR
jgi:hypothetical protein